MTHSEAVKMVRGKTNKEILPDGSVGIMLHSTYVVKIHPDNSATLNTGGWYTSTTKDRINMYSPVRVYQRKGEWYLDDGTPYTDGVTVADMNLVY
jgi:hypothetical protein